MLFYIVANGRRIRMAKRAKNQTNVLKPAAISGLRKWRGCLLSGIKMREDELAAQLRAAVPKSLARWIEAETSLIPNLLEYGHASRKYRQDKSEGQDCGYTDIEEFEQRFEKLQDAWKGIVKIKIFWEDDYHRFEIFFAAV
jgi:hypothetical protein